MPTSNKRKQAVTQFQKDIAVYRSPKPATTKQVTKITSVPTKKKTTSRTKRASTRKLPRPVVQAQEKKETFMTTTRIAAQQAELQRAQQTIDPTKTYMYEGREISGDTALQVIKQQQKEVRNVEKEVRREGFTFQKTVSQYPPTAQFKKTSKGYSVTIPKSEQLRWTKQALKETRSQGPIRGAISRTLLGVLAPVYATGQSIAGLLGQRESYEKGVSVATGMVISRANIFRIPGTIARLESKRRYGAYYPTTPDIAFEKAGWAPKGTTRTLTKYPGTYGAGSVFGELGLSWLIGKGAAKSVGYVAKKLGYVPKPRVKTFYPTKQSKPSIDIFKMRKGGLQLKGIHTTRTTLYKTPTLGYVKVGTKPDKLLFKGVWAKAPKETKKLSRSVLQPGGKQYVSYLSYKPGGMSAIKLQRSLSPIKGMYWKRTTLTESFSKLTISKAEDIGRGAPRGIGLPIGGPTYGITGIGGTTTVAVSRGGLRTIPKPVTTFTTGKSLTPAITTIISKTPTTGGTLATQSTARGISVFVSPSIISSLAPASVISRMPTQQKTRSPTTREIQYSVSDKTTTPVIRIPSYATTPGTGTITIPRFDTRTEITPRVTPTTTVKSTSVHRVSTKIPIFARTVPAFKIPFIPLPSLGPGRGPWSWGEESVSPKYKFRKFDIGGLFK